VTAVLPAPPRDPAAAPLRAIASISSLPRVLGIDRLVGAMAGANLRTAIALPDQLALGPPTRLLLDDLAGATLFAGLAFL
jgi:hypothetical protein